MGLIVEIKNRSRRAALRLPFSIPLNVLLIAGCFLGLASPIASANSMPLATGWKLQSACVANSPGQLISSESFRPEGWIDTSVPATVLAAQVNDGIFPEPFFGMNLRKIPGTDYPIGKIFGYFPMSASSPYRCSWWYRTTFTSNARPGEYTSLHFDGINYRANIWLNGQKIAGQDKVAGAFRSYDFDISKLVKPGAENVLAVEVFAQTENDLGIDFLDWNPAPADKNLGLWRGVSLMTSGPVTIANLAVATHFLKEDLSLAELRIVTDLINHANHSVTATITAGLRGTQLKQQVELAAGETRAVHFDPEAFPQLRLNNPKLWWPYQYGDPHLEQLEMRVQVGANESDAKTVRFGIREIDSSLNDRGFRQFRINRRNILIRGGGWAPDLFYREPDARLRQELTYVKDMGLNTIRLEGKLGSDAMFDLADEMGILIMAGWQCCDYWQKWDKWTPADRQIANASLMSQISRLRSHPSLLVWLNGSDEAPPPDIEKESLATIEERNWPNPVLSSAADRTSTLTGRSGVKMSGPYDYVPPEYWYLDKDKLGGAFGFNTETGPGAAIPLASSIRRTLPQTSWWPIDEQWNYHAGLGKFAQYSNFNNAMNATYGPPGDLDDYEREAQLMAYDGERAMFEAYGAKKYTSTGVIQWMLNNAWPSFIWHLYDYHLVPGGGYYGARKANEPLHIQYRYDDRGVAVVNSTLTPHRNLTASATVFDLDGTQIFSQGSPVTIEADGVAYLFSIPVQTATTLLKLDLHDERGTLISENLYWLPARLATLDWEKSTYVNTPALSYADMRDLAKLPPASVSATAALAPDGRTVVRLTNSGKSIAFFLHLRAVKAGADEDIAPVFWDDNFISLLPGESRDLHLSGLRNAKIEIKLAGWNLPPRTLRVAPDTVAAKH
jgi:exo-1,4-beta-D-glucosaminidase